MTDTTLQDKVAVVTGAASGIGRATAQALAERGARVVVADIARDAGEAAAAALRDLGRAAHFVEVDLTDGDSTTRFAQQVQTEFGPVDILVNAAGWGSTKPFWEGTPELWDKLVALNFVGPMRLAKALLPAMLERGAGHIVQISTIGVQTGAPNFAAYVASKAAADHFTRSLRLEVGGRGIAVTTIQIPLVRTAMLAPTRIYDAFPALGAEQAARRIGWAVVKRPVRVAPRWSTFIEVVHAVAPGLLQWVFTHGHEPFHRAMARRLERRNRRH